MLFKRFLKKLTLFSYRILMFPFMLLLVVPHALLGDVLYAVGKYIRDANIRFCVKVIEFTMRIETWSDKE